MTIYDLTKAIRNTAGAQRASHTEALRNKVWGLVHAYADACAAPHFESQTVADAQANLDVGFDYVFALVSED